MALDRADRGGGLDADVVELEGQLDDEDVEHQSTEQRTPTGRPAAPRQRRELLSRGRWAWGAGCQMQRAARTASGRLTAYSQNGVAPVLRAQRATDAEEDRGGDRRVDDLQAEVPLALRAVEVVGQQRGAAGHDRGLGEADQHPADDDQLQRGQPQRRGADEGVGDERPDEQPLAAQPVDDPPGEGGGEADDQRGRGEHDRRQRLDARGAREGVLDPRQHGRQQHGTEHGQAAGQEQDERLRPARRPTGGRVDCDLTGERFLTAGVTQDFPTRASPEIRAPISVIGVTGREVSGARARAEITSSEAGYQPRLWRRRPVPDGQLGGAHDDVAQIGVLGVVVEHRVPPHRLDQLPDLDRRRQRPEADVRAAAARRAGAAAGRSAGCRRPARARSGSSR